MERALAQARAAAQRGEVPVGAVMVGPDGRVLAAAGNRMEAGPIRPPMPSCWRSGRRRR